MVSCPGKPQQLSRLPALIRSFQAGGNRAIVVRTGGDSPNLNELDRLYLDALYGKLLDLGFLRTCFGKDDVANVCAAMAHAENQCLEHEAGFHEKPGATYPRGGHWVLYQSIK